MDLHVRHPGDDEELVSKAIGHSRFMEPGTCGPIFEVRCIHGLFLQFKS